MKKVLVGVVITLAAICAFFLVQKYMADDLDGLAGDPPWAVVMLEDHGQKIPVAGLKVKGISFAKDTVTWIMQDDEDKLAGLPGKLKIDPSKDPKEIDLEMPGGGMVPGIYEIQRDKLRICIDDKQRPKDFSGAKHMVWVLKR